MEDEVAAAKQLSEALQRELPPAAAGTAAAAGASGSGAVGVVDDSSTSGAPAAALQLVAVPGSPGAGTPAE